MRTLGFSLEQFAADRRGVLDRAEQYLAEAVASAIARWGDAHWFEPILQRAEDLFDRSFVEEAGGGEAITARDRLIEDLRDVLDKTGEPRPFTGETLARYVATATVNAATEAAVAFSGDVLVMEWVTMHDDKVRETHRELEGQRRGLGDSFDVNGVSLRYPGDVSAPIAYWINCRCVIRPDQPNADERRAMASLPQAFAEGDPMTEPVEDQQQRPVDKPATVPMPDPIPWHGILAPEGTKSGDKRGFKKGSLRSRNLPLRLTWQKASADGHDGSVVVGSIEGLHRHDPGGDQPNQIRAHGHFLQTPEADEVIGQAAAFGNLGVSVDLDDSTFEFDSEDPAEGGATFTDARICSASIVTIPAFHEAVIVLGDPPDGFMGDSNMMDPDADNDDDSTPQSDTDKDSFAVSEKSWDGSASRFTPEQWRNSCILDTGKGPDDSKSRYKLPIKEPNGDLSRSAVHAAAGRIGSVDAPSSAISSAKSKLRGAYRQLGETPPDSLGSDEVETFDRGPGWITHPADTKRIHDYWTVPGQPGYEKVQWGAPGDYNRCIVEIGQEIGEHDAQKLRFMHQICAQWHHDALGIWPATHAKELGGEHALEGVPAPAVTLTASGERWVPPSEWFEDPQLPGPTFTTLEDHPQGTRIYGHLACWSSCHTGFPGVCVTPPQNYSGYSAFHLGTVYTDNGPVKVGQLSLGGGHADTRLDARAALAHYDNVATAVADIRVGEDAHGIWFAGWLRPNITEQQRYELLAHKVSGDWRNVAGAQEMIALCCVNVPGFITRSSVVDGVQVGLVAAAGPAPEPKVTVEVVKDGVNIPELAEALASEIAARETRKNRMTALAERVGMTPQARLARVRERFGGQ